jgi:hypothetical protein
MYSFIRIRFRRIGRRDRRDKNCPENEKGVHVGVYREVVENRGKICPLCPSVLFHY